MQDRIQAARAAIAWDVSQVYPVVDASVLLETPAPRRTWVEPGSAALRPLARAVAAVVFAGRVDSLGRSRRSGSVSGRARPVRRRPRWRPWGCRRSAPDAPPLAKALALAALLRSVPWRGGRRTLGARLLPLPERAMALVGVYRGEAYRVGRCARWEPLFADGRIDRPVGLREIELAAGHLRLADDCAAPLPGAGDAQD